MIAESILFVLIFSMIKKYNFSNTEFFPKKYITFPLVFVVINVGLFVAAKTGASPVQIRILHMLSFVFFYPYMIKNYKYTGMLFLIAGVSLNLIVMYLNGFRMPIDPYFYSKIASANDYALTRAGFNLYHSLIDENTVLYLLGDTIPLMKPYPFPKVVSIGDVLIGIGFSALAITALRGDYNEKNEEGEISDEK